ncbi:response regulator [Vibrio coralliilyticus]|uniref:ATP-binding protein n=1 Tax=Vibrio TaxID=662 RepID=UPI00148DCBC4|nr:MULTISPECIES: ATP-binding protein [Vibrio]MCC2520949.1 response regulator [Vibrio coralliilyticus]NOH51696.1 response regulator [Vibrio coralliilyticus]NRF25337.1 response regulator [Vibrio coralliilyticus]NRF79601.1 response regulator [Vibrio coralliilyticus]WFB49745.1 ATP-binding protein [Vibrio coralliilyticus]
MNKQRQLGIDKQLVIVTLLVSLVLAFVMAGVNFYVDYQAEQNNLDKQMLQIEDSYVASLQNSLWIEDQKQLTTQASSIFQLPAVDRLTIIDSKSTLIELGNEITGKKVINVWDLTYQLGNKSFTLGQLRIETDLAPVYHALWQKFLFLLVMTLIQTLLIVSCLLWLTMKLILKPISHLSSAMADFHTSPTPDKLVMPKRLFHDEISHLTDKYNQCAEQLRVNYQQIIESKEKAEIANVKKSEFLANMSHEIRTPMNGIVGVAELLKETKPNEVQRNYVDILLTSSHTLLDIINDILDFSKIEAGHFELDPTKFDLKSLIQQQANEYSIRAKQQELFFDCNIDPAVPQEIEADSVRLKQVINNLIGNALKFTHRGYVELNIKLLENETGNQLQFEVKDTGIGIAKDKLDSIFDKFQQADGSTARQYGGTGLGLAISQKIVELMGGKLQVTSEVDLGSSFYFSIPIDTPSTAIGGIVQSSPNLVEFPASSGTQMKKLSPKYKTGLKVLVVEDTRVNQQVIQVMLNLLGLEVDIANNGVEALEYCQQNEVDAILMDCHMPVMDGYEATQKIRQLEGWAAYVPIIAVTANVIKEDRERCFEIGMNGFLSKPVKPKEIEEALIDYVPAYQSAQNRAKVANGNSLDTPSSRS